MYKTDSSLVDAVTEPCRSAHIFEKVPQMLAALAAQQLHALPIICAERLVDNVVRYLLPEAGKARPDLKFTPGLEQRIAATGTGIGTGCILPIAGRYLLPVPEHLPAAIPAVYFSRSSTGTNFMESELTQWRTFFGVRYSPSNTWPR